MAFFRWGAALIRHWIALLGGAAVSVGLLVWAQYAPPGLERFSETVWWSGLAVGFILASFFTWNEEQEAAAALAVKRPEFSPKYAGFEQAVDPAGALRPNQFLVRFWFHNRGGISAVRFKRRVLIISDYASPPVVVATQENANTVFDDVNIRGSVSSFPNPAPPHYFVVQLDYQDSRNQHRYTQEFFYVWAGGTGEFPMHFQDATFEQRGEMLSYMKATELTDGPTN